VGVVTGQQLEQQFVQVAAGQQGLARGHDVPALPRSGLEGAHLGIAAPTQPQGLQRQQHRAELGGGALDPLGRQHHPTMLLAEHIQNQAGLAPVVPMQHESRLIVDTKRFGRGFGHKK
jgi:hypothetical protein